jgi:hypothetical protein
MTPSMESGQLPSLTAWPYVIIFGVGILLLILLVNGSRIFRGTRTIMRSFWCPFAKRLVDVDFGVDAWDGRRVDVEACSAFVPCTAITCEKHCLHVGSSRRPAPASVSVPH